MFLDGCYGHGCPEHSTLAKTNAEYWSPKISGNRKRDADTDRRLIEGGWLPLRIWEHEDVTEASQRVLALIGGRL